MKSTYFALATLLVASPMAGALAQQSTSPSVGADNTKEATDVKDGSAKSGMPGATGKTVVPGSNSTVAGDKGATAATQTGTTGTAGGGGSGK